MLRLFCKEFSNKENIRMQHLPHCLFLFVAAGAVCAERIHPVGAGPGGLGVQTLLPASAGPS